MIQLVWGYLYDVSFITINTMISMSVPGIAQLIQQVFLNLIYVDLLWAEYWLPQLFTQEGEGESNTFGLNRYFEENGFDTQILINNLGSTFVFLSIYCSMLAIYGGIKLIALKIER